ncbi:protein YgfX [Methylomonas sp. 2BW1-5-20]|uniref:protein YgfX n=1 Tax=Methylomonas sp. 2BW1-5-20 TaxID=3376686 RepID=UPI00404BD1C0
MAKNLVSNMDFTVSRSRLLKLLIHGIHGFTVLACWLNSLPVIYQAALSVLALLSWRHGLKSRQTGLFYLRYTPDRGWSISLANEYRPIKIASSTTISPFLIVLHWLDNDNAGGCLLIAKDAMPADSFRKLVVCLKTSGYRPV